MSEKNLDELACDGSNEAIAILYEKLMPLTRHIAKKYAKGRDDIDEMVSEASFVLMRCVENFDPDRENGSAFKTYYVRSAHNQFSNFYRKRREVYIDNLEVEDNEQEERFECLFDTSLDDGTTKSTLASEAAAFANTLSETQQRIIMDIINCESIGSIANSEGTTENEIRNRLRRAVGAIANHLDIYSPHLLESIPKDLRRSFVGEKKTLFDAMLKTAQSLHTDQH